MRGKFQKTTNFFHLTTGDANTGLSALRSTTAAPAGPWNWGAANSWHDQLSGKAVLEVAANMQLQRLPGRRYRLTLPNVQQYIRGHRFVYKLDAFNAANDSYLFTVVTPRIRHVVDRYDETTTLTLEGLFPPSAGGGGGNIYWIRRGAGEWRD